MSAVRPQVRPPWRRLLSAPRVFLPAALFIIGFVLLAALLPDELADAVTWLQERVVSWWGWYYVALVAAFVIISVVLAVGPYGRITLGRDGEKPEFSLLSWIAMLFTAGMGIGLVFWGVAEPLSHLANPRPGDAGDAAREARAARAEQEAVAAGHPPDPDADPPVVADQGYQWFAEPGNADLAADATTDAFTTTFLHWGIHAWGIYVIVGLAIAYAVYRKGRPVSIRWALEPVLGRRVHGWLGDLVDVVAIVGTVFGVATSLGLGALQIGFGMSFLDWIRSPTQLVTVLLIVAITAFATISVVTGLKRGIKWLSNFNVSLAAVLLVLVLVAGPTVYLLRGYIQHTGDYLQSLFTLSFDVGADQGAEGQAWQSVWTIFYWGWWISWAPFVGIFIARISRGRTVREFVAGVLLVPTSVSFLWFSVLGGTAVFQVRDGGRTDELVPGVPPGEVSDAPQGPSEEGSLFIMLEGLPLAAIVVTLISAAAVVLIATFFVTSSDSGSLVCDMLASGGDPEPPVWSRVFWALLEGAVAVALLVLIPGDTGLQALRVAAILAALPFSVIMIAMCVALWKDFRAEHEQWRRAERERRTRELTDHITRTMVDGGLLTTDDSRP